jgi:hypothetical protein
MAIVFWILLTSVLSSFSLRDVLAADDEVTSLYSLIDESGNGVLIGNYSDPDYVMTPSVQDYPDFMEQAECNSAEHTVRALVAADEEFQQISYWVPPLTWLGWQDASINIIERGDDSLWNTFGCNVRIGAWVTYDSDDHEYNTEERLKEACREVGWDYSQNITGRYVGPCATEVLVVLTDQKLDYWDQTAGAAKTNGTCMIMKSRAYWKDDNIFQHEFSHILGAHDHEEADPSYSEDCVMSYREVYVGLWYEDGWIFWVDRDVKVAFLTEAYCITCNNTLTNTIYILSHRGLIGGGGGGDNFPLGGGEVG